MTDADLKGNGGSQVSPPCCKMCGEPLDLRRVENNGLVDYVHCGGCGYDWQLWKLGTEEAVE